jgi:hypothetical protein
MSIMSIMPDPRHVAVITKVDDDDGETFVDIHAGGEDESIPTIETPSVVFTVRGALLIGNLVEEAQISIWARVTQIITGILAANSTIKIVGWGKIGLNVPSLHPWSSEEDKQALVNRTPVFVHTPNTKGIIVVRAENPTFMALPGARKAMCKAWADAQTALKAGRGGIILALLHNGQLDEQQTEISGWLEEQENLAMQKLSD